MFSLPPAVAEGCRMNDFRITRPMEGQKIRDVQCVKLVRFHLAGGNEMQVVEDRSSTHSAGLRFPQSQQDFRFIRKVSS